MIKVVQATTVHSPADARITHRMGGEWAQQGAKVYILYPDRYEVDAASAMSTMAVEFISVPTKDIRGRLKRVLVAPFRMYKAIKKLSPQIVQIHDPELLICAVLLKASGIKIIYDIHEDLPKQVLNKPWLPAPTRRVIAHLAFWVEYSSRLFVDMFCAATPHIAKRFPLSRTVIVRNFPRRSELASSRIGRKRAKNPSLVVYIGAISKARGLDVMLGAAKIAKDSSLNVQFVLAGPTDSGLTDERLWRAFDDGLVDYRGVLNRSDVLELLAKSQIGLCMLAPTPSYMEALPVKIFEFMGLGLPFICSDFGLMKEIALNTGAGVTATHDDPNELFKTIQRLLIDPHHLEEMGRRGMSAVDSEYSWEPEGRRLIERAEALKLLS